MAVSSPRANGALPVEPSTDANGTVSNGVSHVEPHRSEWLSEPSANANGTVSNGVSHELEPNGSQGFPNPSSNSNATVLNPPPRPRHKHELREQNLQDYKCSGCKESGGGVCFECGSCHFILHECCKTLADDFEVTRLGETFHFRCKTSLWTHYCKACGDMLKGFVFETKGNGLGRNKRRLHPWCLNLLVLHPTLQFREHADHILRLDENNLNKFSCSACKEENYSGCWRYTCRECNYNVDMSCAKIQISSLTVVRVADRRLHRRPGHPPCFKWIAQGLCDLGGDVGSNLLADAIKELCCGSCLDDEDDETDPPVTQGDQTGPSATDTQPAGNR